MKIRTGFVSNSSSSSFVLFFKDIDISKISPEELDERQIAFFADGCEGLQLNYVKTSDILELCQENTSKVDIDYFDVIFSMDGDCYDYEDMTEELCEKLKGTKMSVLTIDQHSFNTYDEYESFFNEVETNEN